MQRKCTTVCCAHHDVGVLTEVVVPLVVVPRVVVVPLVVVPRVVVPLVVVPLVVVLVVPRVVVPLVVPLVVVVNNSSFIYVAICESTNTQSSMPKSQLCRKIPWRR